MPTPARRRTLTITLLTTLPFLAGCYVYVPVHFETAQPGLDVRVHLSREGVFEAQDQLGRAYTSIDGTVLGRDPEVLLLGVDLPAPEWQQAGSGVAPLHQRLALRRSIVIEMEQRRLHRTRTAALVAGAAAALGVLVRYSLRVRDPGGETQPPPVNGEV